MLIIKTTCFFFCYFCFNQIFKIKKNYFDIKVISIKANNKINKTFEKVIDLRVKMFNIFKFLFFYEILIFL